MRTSSHSRDRIVERDELAESRADAKKVAKTAYRKGATINQYQKYPKFFKYLQSRRGESASCSVRIYRDNIYIWKGSKKTLITCHPIPNRFLEEIAEVDEVNNI